MIIDLRNDSKNKIIAIIVISLGLLFAGYKSLEAQAVSKLEDLGYTTNEARIKVNPFNVFTVVNDEEVKLKTIYNLRVDYAKQALGINDLTGLNTNDLIGSLTEVENITTEKKDFYVKRIAEYKAYLTKHKIKYSISSKDTLLKQYQSLDKVVQKRVRLLENQAFDLGITTSELKKMSKDKIKRIEQLNKAIAKIKKQNSATGGKYDRAGALRMFAQINAHRRSRGLKPYRYAEGRQSCVDNEATAYANTRKPHNWVCKAAANENAGLASINSNYVKIAMDFFITDPPHHRVLIGGYTSAAVSIVFKGNMAYMIVDVF